MSFVNKTPLAKEAEILALLARENTRLGLQEDPLLCWITTKDKKGAVDHYSVEEQAARILIKNKKVIPTESPPPGPFYVLPKNSA